MCTTVNAWIRGQLFMLARVRGTVGIFDSNFAISNLYGSLNRSFRNTWYFRRSLEPRFDSEKKPYIFVLSPHEPGQTSGHRRWPQRARPRLLRHGVVEARGYGRRMTHMSRVARHNRAAGN